MLIRPGEDHNIILVPILNYEILEDAVGEIANIIIEYMIKYTWVVSSLKVKGGAGINFTNELVSPRLGFSGTLLDFFKVITCASSFAHSKRKRGLHD